MTVSAGTRLGSYEIVAPLGAGGMGEVWRAHDARLSRDVAIKLLPEAVAGDPHALSRFRTEARAVASLSHPNILAIHELCESEGLVYAVMELLEGETLRERLAGGPLGARKATELAVPIARALAAAHERGVVHRDLKPENLFLTRDGVVKVLDFGLARVAPALDPSSSNAPTVAGTAPGTVLGTAGYMSPEQVRGLPVDHRSDIFSFGCVLLEMITGRRAFRGDSAIETMNSILREEPTELEAPLPPALSQIVHHCLEKRPEDRFQSARDLAFALTALSPSSATAVLSPAAAPGRRRGLVPWAAGLAAAAALAAGALLGRLLWTRPVPPRPVVRFAIPPAPDSPFTGMLALSPDGKRLAFVATGADGNDRLFVRDMDSLEARLISGTEGASFPFFSPDGEKVAFFSRGSLRTVGVAGGAAQTLCAARDARGGSWSREGFLLFAPRGGAELESVPASGGEPKRVLAADKFASVRWPHLLPDGRHFTFMSLGRSEGTGVRLGTVGSSETRLLATGNSGAVYAAGSLVYGSGRRLVRQPFDLSRLEMTGPSQPIAEDVYWDAFASGFVSFAVSADGALAYLAGGISTSKLTWYNRSGERLGTVGPPAPYFEPVISPDGKRAAVSRIEPETGTTDVWLLDLERGGLARLSRFPLGATPLFSADGSRIAYSTFPAGRVYTGDVSGSGEQPLLFDNGGFCILEDWAEDGRLFYTSLDLKTFRFRAFSRAAGGGVPEPLEPESSANLQHERLSPNGHWLAYVSDESGTNEVLVRSYPDAGERMVVSSGGGSQPQWRDDGKELFYVTPDRKIMAVPISTSPRFEPGRPAMLFQSRILAEVEARNHYATAPDGQRFLLNERREEDAGRAIIVVLDALGGR